MAPETHEFTQTTASAVVSYLNSFSKANTLGPEVNQPVLISVSFISAITSESMTGREKGMFMLFNYLFKLYQMQIQISPKPFWYNADD